MPLAEFQHTTLQHQVGDMNIQHRACHLCAWVSEQETLQVKKLRRQLYNPMLQVQLCLPHARAVLRQFPMMKRNRLSRWPYFARFLK